MRRAAMLGRSRRSSFCRPQQPQGLPAAAVAKARPVPKPIHDNPRKGFFGHKETDESLPIGLSRTRSHGDLGRVGAQDKGGLRVDPEQAVLPRWRDARLGAVSTDAIQKWINELASTRSPKTVRNVYGVLRSALNVAVEHRYITGNPCEAVRLPKRSKAKGNSVFSAMGAEKGICRTGGFRAVMAAGALADKGRTRARARWPLLPFHEKTPP
jgi:hypothetical protein